MKKLFYNLWRLGVILIAISLFNQFTISQWVTQNSGTTQHLYDVDFINTQTGWACGDNGTIIVTTNGGLNWMPQISNASAPIYCIQFVNASTGFVLGSGFTRRTTNSGLNWLGAGDGLGHYRSCYFVNHLTGWIVGQTEFGNALINKTTDGGLSWLFQQSGTNNSLYSVFFADELNGWTVGGSGTIRATTNGGLNWFSQQADGTAGFSSVHFQNTSFGCAAGNRIFITTNGGLNWKLSQLSGTQMYSVDFVNSYSGFATGFNGTILATTNGGLNWVQQQSGTNISLASVSIADSATAWIAGLNGLILKTTNGGITHLISSSGELPTDYTLEQNFPNPFNPFTKIRFSLPSLSKAMIQDIELKIYDVLSREIAILVNGQLKPGIYETSWDASNYPSGIYFYRITSAEFSDTKKMILVK